MIKVGRNQPCHCGSGKKHKNCCRAADEAAAAAARPAKPPPAKKPGQEQPRFQAVGAIKGADSDSADRLDELSNGALDLIHALRLDDAERMCQALLEEFPDVIDGHMRLGQLHRVRGDAKRAAEHLRQAAAMAQTPDYDPEVAADLAAEADKLDPPTAAH